METLASWWVGKQVVTGDGWDVKIVPFIKNILALKINKGKIVRRLHLLLRALFGNKGFLGDEQLTMNSEQWHELVFVNC